MRTIILVLLFTISFAGCKDDKTDTVLYAKVRLKSAPDSSGLAKCIKTIEQMDGVLSTNYRLPTEPYEIKNNEEISFENSLPTIWVRINASKVKPNEYKEFAGKIQSQLKDYIVRVDLP